VLARPPFMLEVLLNLPYPIVLLWVLWGAFVPWQVGYLFRRNPGAHQLSRTGELMNFREVLAVGCVGGFILLTLITAFCTYITLSLAGVLR
jgi:hypothetical protein